MEWHMVTFRVSTVPDEKVRILLTVCMCTQTCALKNTHDCFLSDIAIIV